MNVLIVNLSTSNFQVQLSKPYRNLDHIMSILEIVEQIISKLWAKSSLMYHFKNVSILKTLNFDALHVPPSW